MSIRLMYSPFRGLGGWLTRCPLALDNDGVWLSFQPRTTLKSSKDTRYKRSTIYPSLQTRGSGYTDKSAPAGKVKPERQYLLQYFTVRTPQLFPLRGDFCRLLMMNDLCAVYHYVIPLT